MSESQSRYGIMEELNNRKINQREKLANLEREKDNHVFQKEQETNKLTLDIEDREKNYKFDFTDRQRQREVNLKLLTADFNRKKNELETAMKEDKATYVDEFKEWKKAQEGLIKLTREELARYTETQDKKIKDKQAVIDEIEEGVKSLKEISSGEKKD